MYNPRREEEILNFWEENQIFKKSLEKTKEGKPFVFYDGPPFASGQPHFGHVLPSTIKDIIPRYQTMLGRYVPRVWGWDCHGLPIENLVEKKLGLKNKKDIEEYGVEKFNLEARNSVFGFVDDWKKIIPRIGRWADMENDYRTMDPTFTESVWWSFKTLYDKKLAYEGFKVMHFCPHCGTVLSNFEVGQGYKDITDISVTVEFELKDKPNAYVLVWTTTPWTLPGNVALAVNPEVEYCEVTGLMEGNSYILAKERVEKVFGEKFNIIKTFPGSELIGKSYKPLFDYYSSQKDLPNHERGWKIYGADFVTTTDGTGVVHIAPAFGQDDLNLGIKEKLPFVQHVGTDGRFKSEVHDFAGLSVKPKSEESNGHQVTDVEIIKYLAKKDVLFSKEKLIHSYPHCWRCDTPLLNYATSSWFIKVTDFKDKLIKQNSQVNWNPSHVGTGRFGKWLENVIDWGISRTRFWGAPLPIWKSVDAKGNNSEIEVIGSLDELKTKIKRNNYFVMRHGEAEHNIRNIMISGLDDGDHLTEAGNKMVEKVSKIVKNENIDVIFVSPLERTKETAEVIKQASGFKGEIIVDERIQEEQFGDIQGKTLNDYIAFYKDSEGKVERITRPLPNGESLLDVRSRISDFLYEIDKKYEDKNILLITHDGIAKMISAVALGGTTKNLLSIWGTEHYYSLSPGEHKKIEFSSLPRNEMNELDLHRPYIDEIKWKSKSGAEMTRIKDVFDTWYDSGSMPYASKHFLGKGELKDFPADFINESIDQTRGWFYSLLVLGVGLFDKSPYNNVVVGGLILAEDGRKLAKKLNNYVDILPTVEKYGADALRYFLISSPAVKSEDVSFSEKALDDIVKKHFNRLYNVISLYEMYAGPTPNPSPKERGSKNPLDQWIIALLHKTRNEMTSYLDSYELDKATKLIGDFIENLSTWYIRRSRDRFKNKDQEALATTHYVLMEFSKIMAPFIPFLAEDLYQRLVPRMTLGTTESVHLCDWPTEQKVDEKILKQMEEVRKVVTLGLELRTKAGIKVRQPLSRFEIREDSADIGEEEGLLELIKDELNVKEVIFDANRNEPAVLDTEITSELRKEGIAREIIRTIQELRKEKGLQPGDEIEVSICSLPEIHHIVSEHKEMISKVTSVTNFLFEESDNKDFEIKIV